MMDKRGYRNDRPIIGAIGTEEPIMGEIRPDIEKAISKIVHIINEAVPVGGMSKRHSDALKDGLRTLVCVKPAVK